ncbi:MAG: FISUMP domain-containing protein, partial [Bacteroidota bacterium]
MKKLVILCVLFFYSLFLFGQVEPEIKFYLNDGSSKQFKIGEIKNLNFSNKNINALLIILCKNKTISYRINTIENIRLIQDSLGNPMLSVLITDTPQNIYLSEIDRILIQPLYYSSTDSVIIGNQVWMSRNLDVVCYRNGDTIPEVKDPDDWAKLTTGAWCWYNNDSTMGAIYGRLYNWFAVSDPRGLAPGEWHIPNDIEWTNLTDNLGGENFAGSKLKEAETSHWQLPNEGSTNESGFTGLPGGWRGAYGTFDNNETDAYWWSTVENNSEYALYRNIYYRSIIVYRDYYYKRAGLSVRCMKYISDTPTISNIIPNAAIIGTEIVVNGISFGFIQDTNFVTINDKVIKNISFWSNSQIKLTVPLGTT